MKIISKFKDYYDVALGLGFDESLVFFRERKTFQPRSIRKHGRYVQEFMRIDGPDSTEEALMIDTENVGLYNTGFDIRKEHQNNKYSCLRVGSGTILLCGKPHPWMVFAWVKPETLEEREKSKIGLYAPTYPSDWSFCYSKEEAFAFLNKVNPEILKVDSSKLWSRSQTNEERIEKFFSQESNNYVDWAITNKVALFCKSNITGVQKHPSGNSYPGPLEDRAPQLQFNPCLKDFEFYRLKAAHEVYQEIAMFLGNIASKDDTPVKISDKDRIAQHGFDQYSFRKAPTKKR